MAKRKVLIEGTVKYIILTPEGEAQYHRGYINLAKTFQVTVDIKSKSNSGGEAWDWAQKNWPDFVGDDGPEVTIDGDKYETLVQWFEIGGVTNLKGDYLPIEATKYPRSATPKGCKAIDEGKSKKTKKKPASTKTPKQTTSKAKTANKSSQLEEAGSVESMEEYKVQKIKEVFDD